MRIAVVLAFLVVAGMAGGLAALSSPVSAQRAPEAETTDSRRYRVVLVRVSMPPGSLGVPLTLDAVADKDHPAHRFLSKEATAAGLFGSLRYPHDLVARLGALGEAEVVCRGEMGVTVGDTCVFNTGREFPVRVVEQRGNQTIATSKFQKVGVTAEIRPLDGGRHDVNLQLSVVSAWSPDGLPVIFSASSKGKIVLEDGYTAVFDFLDRTEAESLDRPLAGRVGDERERERSESARDVVARFIFLLTRLDLEPR